MSLANTVGTIHVRCQQSVSEFVRVETFGEPRNMPRRMVFDVNLSPWTGWPCSNARIDPEFLGDTASARYRGRAGIVRGLNFAWNISSDQCSYA